MHRYTPSSASSLRDAFSQYIEPVPTVIIIQLHRFALVPLVQDTPLDFPAVYDNGYPLWSL